jgi:hypothetical protein
MTSLGDATREIDVTAGYACILSFTASQGAPQGSRGACAVTGDPGVHVGTRRRSAVIAMEQFLASWVNGAHLTRQGCRTPVSALPLEAAFSLPEAGGFLRSDVE